MEPVYWVMVGQLAAVGMLFKWLHGQTRDNRLALEKVMKGSYSKEEIKELIDMKQEPLRVGIQHVQDDLKELKHMIGRLLDEKNAK